MYILETWKESLAILKPDKLKLFVLVTIKTIIDVYRSLNKPSSWTGGWIIAVVILQVGLTDILRKFGLVFIEGVVVNTLYHALLFFFILGMRPSIEIKTSSYFYYKTKEYWYLLLITIILGLLPVYIVPLLFIYYNLFLIFALDSFATFGALIQSLKNGAFMLFYNLPIFIIVYFMTALLNLMLHYLIAFALGYFGGITLATILYGIFIPIEVALIMNLYITLIHNQPSLYFNQPE